MSLQKVSKMKDINVLLDQYRRKKRSKISQKRNTTPVRFCAQLYPGGLYDRNLTPPATTEVKSLKTKPKPSRKILTTCDATNENCPICFWMVNDEKSKPEILSCRHAFHQKCISEWKNHSNICPLCRTEMWNLDLETLTVTPWLYKLILINTKPIQIFENKRIYSHLNRMQCITRNVKGTISR